MHRSTSESSVCDFVLLELLTLVASRNTTCPTLDLSVKVYYFHLQLSVLFPFRNHLFKFFWNRADLQSLNHFYR